MPLYFAYGSNLLTTRLVARCPGARPVGRAWIEGHRVGFAKYSFIDGSGKATLMRAPGAVSHGVVYDLPAGEVASLDAFEGVGKGYDRHDAVAVVMGDRPVEACTYVATDPREGQRPFDWYLALILAGALEHGLPPDTHASFRRHPWDTDAEHERPARRAAVEALEAAGHSDWVQLLDRPAAG